MNLMYIEIAANLGGLPDWGTAASTMQLRMHSICLHQPSSNCTHMTLHVSTSQPARRQNICSQHLYLALHKMLDTNALLAQGM